MQQYLISPSLSKLQKLTAGYPVLTKEASELKEKLEQCQTLRRRKVPWNEIKKIIGLCRSTYFRIRKKVKIAGITGFIKESKKPKRFRTSKVPQSTVDLVLKIRKENPTYGKSKIVVILQRDHKVDMSESTVGRVLNALLKKGQVQRYVHARGSKQKRSFKSHAKKWQYTMKSKEPGEMVQIDHMTATKNNVSVKHFQAWDPITKTIAARALYNATSLTAAKFLAHVISAMPFPIKSIQVDGGSEFMKDFEAECAKLNIELYVLPPNRPQYNGGVERGNRTFREEFYARKDILADSVSHLDHELQKGVLKYNSYRPHFSLKGMTPLEYYRSSYLGASQSNML
jgi:predicted transcriptional regulator